jgi:hypothetical protein
MSLCPVQLWLTFNLALIIYRVRCYAHGHHQRRSPREATAHLLRNLNIFTNRPRFVGLYWKLDLTIFKRILMFGIVYRTGSGMNT